MAMIEALAHIGMTVSDVERLSRFYCDTLDCQMIRRHAFNESFFSTYRELYQLPDGVTCKTAVLLTPNRVQLELFQFSERLPDERTPWNRAGITHLAFTTDDVPGVFAALTRNGATPCMEVGVRPDGGQWAFLRDPDGNLLEIMQPFQVNE